MQGTPLRALYAPMTEKASLRDCRPERREVSNEAKAVVADYERGVTSRIMPHPWQSETCIGDWHYNRWLYINHSYMKPGEVIRWLVDAVSKNGTFILN